MMRGGRLVLENLGSMRRLRRRPMLQEVSKRIHSIPYSLHSRVARRILGNRGGFSHTEHQGCIATARGLGLLVLGETFLFGSFALKTLLGAFVELGFEGGLLRLLVLVVG